MRRFIAAILCIGLMNLPVGAAEGEKSVALTFDDGPSGRFTRRLLEGLAERNVQATFFLCGYRMEQYPKLAKQIFEAGHEIGIHGYSHKSMKSMCSRQIAQEVRDTAALLPPGCQTAFLRPPGGLCDSCVRLAAEDCGLAILQWSVDPKDWACDDAKEITGRVLRQVEDGDVILLHDMSDNSVDAALMIIDALLAKGFRFVTASELAQAKNCVLIPGRVYTHFREEEQEDK